MDGIEILNSYQVIDYLSGFSLKGLIFAILTIIILFITIIFVEKANIIGIFTMVLAILFSVLSISFFSTANKIEITRYEVILSDEVNYNEFTNKYEVIEQRGKILVVEEK